MKPTVISLIFILTLSLAGISLGQTGNTAVSDDEEMINQYNLAKDLLVSNKFDEAKKLFSQLSKRYENKDIAPFCYYYSAFAHYRAGSLKDGNYLLFQLITKFPDWDKIEMAYYLKGVIQFKSRNFQDAFNQFNKLATSSLIDQSVKAKYEIAQSISNDSLSLLAAKFPQEEVFKNVNTSRKANVTETIPVTPGSFNVALLLPFESAQKNQFIYEIYSGMKLAVDSLAKIGVNINMVPYETGKDSAKILEFLNTKDINNFDLFIGPVYSAQQKWVGEFADKEGIALVNPISNFNGLPNNPKYFSYPPTYETQGKKAAEFALNNFTRRRNAVIVHGRSFGDSIIAYAYKAEFERLGGKVLLLKRLSAGTANYFGTVLSKIPIDSMGHIFVSSLEPSIGANLFSYLEGVLLEKAKTYRESMVPGEKKERKLSPADIPILVPQEWLNFQNINYEQFVLHNTHFICPQFVDQDEIPNNSFIDNYFKTTGLTPTTFAFSGYQMMLYYGMALSKYGKKIWKYRSDLKLEKGYLIPYLDFSQPGGNQFVPIVKIEDLKLKLANSPSP